MKRFGIIHMGALLLAFGSAGLVEARQDNPDKQEEKGKPEKQQENARPPKQEQQAKPERQQQEKPSRQEQPQARTQQNQERKQQQDNAAKQQSQTRNASKSEKNQQAAAPRQEQQARQQRQQQSTDQQQRPEHQQQAESSRPPQRTQQATDRQRSQPAIRLSERGSGRIPDDRFRASFGREHTFRMREPVMVGGYSRFQYGGYWFGFVEPWPSGWYYTDDVYIDYEDDGYYMYDPYYPGARFAISVVI